MNPRTYSLVSFRGQHLWFFSLVLSLICGFTASAVNAEVPFPVWVGYFFAFADLLIVSLSEDFSSFKNRAMAGRLISGSLQILTGAIIAVSDVIEGQSMGQIWSLVAIVFFCFGVKNIAELISLWKERTHKQERKVAANAEQLQKDREAREVDEALLTDLAEFLNQKGAEDKDRS
jgi:hypothetical protein